MKKPLFFSKFEFMEILEQQQMVPKYNLTEEQERKEIVRQYRALLTGAETQTEAGR